MYEKQQKKMFYASFHTFSSIIILHIYRTETTQQNNRLLQSTRQHLRLSLVSNTVHIARRVSYSLYSLPFDRDVPEVKYNKALKTTNKADLLYSPPVLSINNYRCL